MSRPLPAPILLAQSSAEAPGGWFGFDQVFWLTILLVFVLAIIGALLRLRRRDRCLMLLDDFHATYLAGDERTIWGDVSVVNKGLEVHFDAPYVNRRGIAKASALLYEEDYRSCAALCRVPEGLTGAERAARDRQIRLHADPGLTRRIARWMRNILNTIRDAVVKAFSLFTGQIGRTRVLGRAASGQKAQIDRLGEEIIGAAGNAYEALLERHLGRPVVLEFRNPTGDARTELPGYLADYSDRFLAVFSAEYETLERFEIMASESTSHGGARVDFRPGHACLTCLSEDALLLRRYRCAGRDLDLAVVLLKGCSVLLPRAEDEPVTLELERTRTVDVICPRATGRIRFTCRRLAPSRRAEWHGLAPDLSGEDEAPRAENPRPEYHPR